MLIGYRKDMKDCVFIYKWFCVYLFVKFLNFNKKLFCLILRVFNFIRGGV